MAGDWTLEYYVEDNGTAPAREFLGHVDKKTYTRFQWSLEQLRVRNTQASYPLVRKIDGKIWELREESTTNIYRIFYFFFRDRRIVLLHGFAKKTQKTPNREIQTATQRYTRFIQREGGD